MSKLIESRIDKYKDEIKEIRSEFKDKSVLYRIKAHVYNIQVLEARISELEWVLKNITYTS